MDTGMTSSRSSLVAPQVLLLCVLLLLSVSGTDAATFPVYGPQTHERGTGKETSFSGTFTVPDPSALYELVVEREGIPHDARNVAVVILNGRRIIGPDDFLGDLTSIRIPIAVAETNEIHATLEGPPGWKLHLEIVGIDDEAPRVLASVAPELLDAWRRRRSARRERRRQRNR